LPTHAPPGAIFHQPALPSTSSNDAPAATPKTAKKRARSSKSKTTASAPVAFLEPSPTDVETVADETPARTTANWTPVQIETFLSKLVEIANDGLASDGGFKEAQFQIAIKAIFEATGVRYSVSQIRTKWHWAKEYWQSYLYLREKCSGITFDETEKQFDAEDEVWDALIAENLDKHLGRFRNKPVEYWDLLDELFSSMSCGATGATAESVASKASKAKQSATPSDPKKRDANKPLSRQEQIVQVLTLLADPIRNALTDAEEVLDEWVNRHEDDRQGIIIEILDAVSDEFAENSYLARSFICKGERARLRWLQRKQVQLITDGE
jgi:hypothetical protein